MHPLVFILSRDLLYGLIFLPKIDSMNGSWLMLNLVTFMASNDDEPPNWLNRLIRLAKFFIIGYDYYHKRTTGTDFVNNTIKLLVDQQSPLPITNQSSVSMASSSGSAISVRSPEIGASSSSNQRPQSSIPSLDRSKDQEAPDGADSNLLCCICQTNYRNVLFMPCTHTSTCVECSQRLVSGTKLCPICRGTIGQAISYHRS